MQYYRQTRTAATCTKSCCGTYECNPYDCNPYDCNCHTECVMYSGDGPGSPNSECQLDKTFCDTCYSTCYDTCNHTCTNASCCGYNPWENQGWTWDSCSSDTCRNSNSRLNYR